MTALGVLAIVSMSMFGGALVVFMRIQHNSAEYDLDVLHARYLARGAIEVAHMRIREAEVPTGELKGEVQGGSYTVEIREVDGKYEAKAAGMFARRDGSVVTARIVARFRPTESGLDVETWLE
jgi:hypothetical protein